MAFDKWLEPAKTVTPQSAGAYTANYVIGGAMQFDISGSASGGGIINKLLVWDNDNEGAAGALWLFKADLATPIADNNLFAPVFADWDNWITTLTLPAFTTYNSIKQAILPDINDEFKVDANIIYGYFVCSGTPTFAAAKSLRFKLGILTQ